jgi:hypothetical protein
VTDRVWWSFTRERIGATMATMNQPASVTDSGATVGEHGKAIAAAVVAALFSAMVTAYSAVQQAGADGVFDVPEVLAIAGSFLGALVIVIATPINSILRLGKAVAAGGSAAVASLATAILADSAGGSSIVQSEVVIALIGGVVAGGLAWSVTQGGRSAGLRTR